MIAYIVWKFRNPICSLFTLSSRCKEIEYPSKLPTTSIVIVYHNEAWSTLIRTIWSIINRSPDTLLREIILVDDASEREFLRDPLETYLKKLSVKCLIIRMHERSGLIKARLLGATHVTGEVIIFLDAHCECTVGWLEPLLSEISLNRHTVVSPTIDIICDETFQYTGAPSNVWGGFGTTLWFRWCL